MTAQLVANPSAASGLQPIDVTRHLDGLADLIELCFASEMDAGGLSTIREMRALSRFGIGLRVLEWLGLGQHVWTQGYVWVEDGRVVGSVSTQPSEGRSTTWLIANVAVHPEFRRRGLALALMRATLDHIRERGGAAAILQVDDDNLGAIEVYRRLGFASLAVHANWTRTAHALAPAFEPSAFDVRLREWREWAEEYRLALLARPEGLTWNHPLGPDDFRPHLLRRLDQFLSGQVEEHWFAVHPPTQQLMGSLAIKTGFAEGDRLTLLVHPDFHGKVERPLLVRGLRRLSPRPWGVRIEHPAADEPASAVLRDLGFTVTRTLKWMRKEIR
jgi:ribosomal protein S18 acetylase RimI-like enzyme